MRAKPKGAKFRNLTALVDEVRGLRGIVLGCAGLGDKNG